MNYPSSIKQNLRRFYASALLLMLFGISSLFVSARASNDPFFGMVTGATLGGVIGNQFGHEGGRVAATGIGIVAGSVIGADIAQSLDQTNVISYYDTPTHYPPPEQTYYAAPYVPNYVAPAAAPPTYVDDQSGAYCRDYSKLVKIDDHIQESYGTACLQPDGSWRVVQ